MYYVILLVVSCYYPCCCTCQCLSFINLSLVLMRSHVLHYSAPFLCIVLCPMVAAQDHLTPSAWIGFNDKEHLCIFFCSWLFLTLMFSSADPHWKTFNNAHHQATKNAGIITSLQVLCIINKPTAAAIAYGLNTSSKKGGESQTIVYNLGGGMFNISLSIWSASTTGTGGWLQWHRWVIVLWSLLVVVWVDVLTLVV